MAADDALTFLTVFYSRVTPEKCRRKRNEQKEA